MGLDMYINKRIRRYRKADGTFSNSLEDYESDEFGCGNAEWVETEVAYWRKAHSIHNWIMNEVNGGDCYEREVDIDIATVKSLRNTCLSILERMKGQVLRVPKKDVGKFKEFYGDREGYKQRITIDPDNLDALTKVTDYHVISDASVCKELLPIPESSGRDYDGGYLWTLVKTIKMADRIIKADEEDVKNGYYPYYTYEASW